MLRAAEKSSPVALPSRVQLSADAAERRKIYHVSPIYPEAAGQAGVSGTVRIRILINREGFVADMTPISGDDRLVSAALAAVVKWEFKPSTLDGRPATAETVVSVDFR